MAVSVIRGYHLIDRHAIAEHDSRYTEVADQLKRDVWLDSTIRSQHRPVIAGPDALTELLNR